MTDEVAPQPVPLPPEEFPQRLNCPQCKRPYQVTSCQARCNTLLTDVQICCPRCRRKLKKMRLKDWYDHYVQKGPEDLKVHDVFRSPQTSLHQQPRRMGART